jgi:hypothetical protein
MLFICDTGEFLKIALDNFFNNLKSSGM